MSELPEGFQLTRLADVIRDVVVVEIEYGEDEIAEVGEGEHGLQVTLYGPDGSTSRTLPLDGLVAALEEAQRWLGPR